MKTNRKNTIWLWAFLACISLTLASCDHNVHQDEPEGLSIALAWQDASDATTIHNIHLWIYNSADGSLVTEKQDDNTRSLADERFPLNAGEYKVVTMVNMKTPFTLSGTDNYNDMLLALSDPSASPEHAFYGIADATVSKNNAVTLVTDSLRRALSELSITINNVPATSSLEGKITNAADGIYPCIRNTENTYGIAGNTTTEVTLPATTAQGTTLQTATLRLMPTVSGQSNSRITLRITTQEGKVSDFEIEAPTMKPGGKYQITLDYETMQPFMQLSSCIINPWTEGWTYNQEILNPEK